MNESIAQTVVPKRLVLLVKSQKFSGRAGYYLSQGRWHAVSHDKPAPKDVPVVRSMPENGEASMTAEMWGKVYAHPDNTNKGVFVKKLDKLKAAYEAGDAHAILAGSYPNDTTNKKVVKIANYLLHLLGSDHKVEPGLKAGTHAALSASTADHHEQANQAAQQASDQAVVAAAVPEPVAVPADLPPPEPAPIANEAAVTGLALPAFVEGKNTTGVVEYYAGVANAILDMAAAGDVDGLAKLKHYGSKPNSKGKISNTWAGKTANSKLLIALHAEAMESVGGSKPIETPAAAPIAAEPAPPSIMDQFNSAVLNAGSASKASKEAFAYLQANGTTPETVGHAVDILTQHGYTDLAAGFQGAKDKAAEISAAKAAMPTAPADLSGHFALAELVASALKSGDKAAIADVIEQSDLAPADTNLGKIHAYATAAWAYLNQGAPVRATKDTGPKEGDTKEGADGMLVLKDGHWVKVDKPKLTLDKMQSMVTALDGALEQNDQAAVTGVLKQLDEYSGSKKKSVELYAHKVQSEIVPADHEPEPAKAATVPIPAFDGTSPGNQATLTKMAEYMQASVDQHGADGLKGMIVKNKKSISIKVDGKKVKVANPPSAPWAKQLVGYVDDLKAAAGKLPKKAKPAPSPAPAPAAEYQPTTESMDGWEQTGPQGGTNPGGKYKDAEGVEWYCKFPGNDDVAKSEVLAAKLYAAAGIAGQDAKLISKDGKLGIASKWTTVSKLSPTALAKADGAASGFAVDAWLGNWDVVGMEFDNLQVGPDGKAVRIDAGGSLEYRAQGGKKAFGDQVVEIDSLRDAKINKQSAAVFGKLTTADLTASVSKVLGVSDAKIHAIVYAFGPGNDADKLKMINTLIARKADLAQKFPKAKKEKKTKPFKAEKISAPPSFLNWGGSGKSGPSSKEFLNAANEQAVQSIFTAAQTGSLDAVHGLSAAIYNKESGEVTGSAPVLEHPSQHVKGYAQQAINEINYQLNPPKRFRFEGGHPLHSLNSAYPSHKGPLHTVVSKVGKFILLGEPGTISLDTLALPKHTYQSGAISTATFSPAAKKSLAAMPETQKQAIKSYTGSGYQKMNHSLWEGNPSGAAKSAGEALHALGHEITPGTVLSRKISVGGHDLDQILKSSGKILQEPAIMSTSIRPSSWSGNVQLKMHVGPGVKGLWVGKGSVGGNSALSNHAGEDELILPPNTRLLILSVKSNGGQDADGFGGGGISHVIEAVILPTQASA